MYASSPPSQAFYRLCGPLKRLLIYRGVKLNELFAWQVVIKGCPT